MTNRNIKNQAIIKKRIELGLTQGELAELIGVRPNTVCQYENGRRKPRGKIAKRISSLLELPLEEII